MIQTQCSLEYTETVEQKHGLTDYYNPGRGGVPRVNHTH